MIEEKKNKYMYYLTFVFQSRISSQDEIILKKERDATQLYITFLCQGINQISTTEMEITLYETSNVKF